jgi:hypothetical protein
MEVGLRCIPAGVHCIPVGAEGILVLLVEQKLLILPEHMSPPHGFLWVFDFYFH